jgi:hypothetical protein
MGRRGQRTRGAGKYTQYELWRTTRPPDHTALKNKEGFMAKKVQEKIDGLGQKDKVKIRSAIRQVWQRSHPRKLAVNRCIGAGGFSYCEKCKKKSPKVHIDHIVPAGELLSPGFIERMFVSSKCLQGLCGPCHKIKTAEDKVKYGGGKKKKAPAKARRPKKSIEDFY